MPIAAAVPLALKLGAQGATYGPKILAALKGLTLPQIIGGGFIGSEILNQLGQAGERGLTREQLALQTALTKSSAEAAKRETKESKAATEKYLKALMKAKREEAKEEREAMLMQSFMSSQDRQTAMLLQALQGMTSMSSQTGVSPSSGMTALLRSDL